MNPLINCNHSQKSALFSSFLALSKLESEEFNPNIFGFVKIIGKEIDFEWTDPELTPVLAKLALESSENERLSILKTLDDKQKKHLVMLLFVQIEIAPMDGDWMGKRRYPKELAKKIGLSEETSDILKKEAIKYYIDMTN